MLNSTKTWQEDKIKHTAEHIGVISEGALKTLVTDIRKRDMKELIKMLPKEISMSVAIETNSHAGAGHTIGHNYLLKDVKKLIKDYYEN